MHVVRLGYQGIELMSRGRLTLPMPEPQRSRVMSIRRGEVSEAEVISEIEAVERRLRASIAASPLPELPTTNKSMDSSSRRTGSRGAGDDMHAHSGSAGLARETVGTRRHVPFPQHRPPPNRSCRP